MKAQGVDLKCAIKNSLKFLISFARLKRRKKKKKKVPLMLADEGK
jgi:hypothetical protein